MPINSMEVLEAVQQLADIKGIRVTVSQSAKAACIVGGSAFVGSLLGGPVGLGLGICLISLFFALIYLILMVFRRYHWKFVDSN